ncbi:hypothetical protein HDV63DRAFT_234494 [Trichoderma sp. SZMC 28014]
MPFLQLLQFSTLRPYPFSKWQIPVVGTQAFHGAVFNQQLRTDTLCYEYNGTCDWSARGLQEARVGQLQPDTCSEFRSSSTSPATTTTSSSCCHRRPLAQGRQRLLHAPQCMSISRIFNSSRNIAPEGQERPTTEQVAAAMVVAIYATMPATVTRHIAIGVVDTTDATDEISENYPHGAHTPNAVIETPTPEASGEITERFKTTKPEDKNCQ